MNPSSLYSLGIYASLVLISSAWLFPSTQLSVFLGWSGILLLSLFIPKLDRPYRTFFRAGVILQVIGFHWLFFTIRDFGGFGNFSAALVFSVFALGSSLQFIIFIFLWRNLPAFFHRANIAITLAWVSSEILSIRIFPWHLGHTQIAFSQLAQIADISGAIGISAIMVFISESLAAFIRNGKHSNQLVAPLVLIGALLYGEMRISQLNSTTFQEQEVALIQGNITIEEKHNIKMFQVNAKRYLEQTQKIARPGLLIIWPETVITEWIYANLKSVHDDPRGRLPAIPDSALLIGSLTFQSEELLHNSALGIQSDGTLERPYHKQVLMPFGEYTPLGDYLPWLRELNSTVGDFTAGDGIRIFNYQLTDGTNSLPKNIKVAPLICYEDVITRLAREASLQGAELLVNITNDAWFGDTIAPHQHNLIASFRAIENRRYLLRSTNSGLTAIINALGQIEGQLPTFKEGELLARVKIINLVSPFVRYFGDRPWFLVSILVTLLAFFNRFGGSLRKRSNLS